MPQGITVNRSQLIAIVLFMLIIFETAFGNTPLQNYNLIVNRIIFFIEVILFAAFLSTEKYSKRILFFLRVVTVLFFCSYFILNTSLLFRMFMMAMVVAKIGTTESFKIMFKFKTCIILLIIGLSLVGIIPNEYIVVEKGIGTTYGYGLGYTHPNRLASAICCAILCYIGWKKENCKNIDVVIICIVTGLSFYITKSRTLLYCISIYIICYILFKIRFTKKIIKKSVFLVGLISVPLCISSSIIIPRLLLSSSGIVQKIVYAINLVFSRRFTHIEHMFLAYSIPLIGGVFDTQLMNEMFAYSVVDNGYIRFLYEYGIIGLAFFGITSILSFIKLKKKKQYIWATIFIIVAIEGLLENIYVDIGLNLLVIFWGELIENKRKAIK